MDSSLGSPAASRLTKVPIILLHGTWGRGIIPKRQDEGSVEVSSSPPGTRWFENGSQFHKRLEAQLKGLPLDYSLRRFNWSGANSVFERDRAATKLAAELKADLQDRSAPGPIVIAHSHGGNVALRALGHLGDVNRVRLVTLATPFLSVFVRESFQVPWFVMFLVWAATIGITFGAMLLALSKTGLLGGTDPSPWGFAGAFIVAALASIFIVFRLHGIVANRNRAREIQEATSYPAVGLSGPQMLVIRGVDDEAALSLAAGAIGSRLSSQVLFLLPTLIGIGMSLLFVLSWVGVQTESPLLVVTAGGAFTALVLLFLPGICKSVFGKEFMTTAFVCEIAADSAPDAARRIDAITLSPIRGTAGHRMRHGIYDHPECVNQIVDWIRTAETRTAP
jgi:hypothetical protein